MRADSAQTWMSDRALSGSHVGRAAGGRTGPQLSRWLARVVSAWEAVCGTR